MKPKLMFSSRVFGADAQQTLSYAVHRGFAGVEWYLNSFRLRTNRKVREQFFRQLDSYPQLLYTFHLPTVDVELAHRNPVIAASSLAYLELYLEYLSPWLEKQSGPSLVTLHVGSNSIAAADLDWETALINLQRLGEFGARRNCQVLLENLKSGWTTCPEQHLALVDHAGLGITFDSGHAASSPLVRNGELTLERYLDRLAPRIRHVHFYAYESLDLGKHVPPKSFAEIAGVWQRLISLPRAPAIVLELATLAELEQTQRLIAANEGSWASARDSAP